MVKLQPSKLAMRVRFPLPAPIADPVILMIRLRFFFVFLSLLVWAGVVGAQNETRCSEAQRELEAVIREYPEKAAENLANHARRRPDCAGSLVESAIAASQASDELVAQMVKAAVGVSPTKAVVIAERAIASAPSASDEVAIVVQEILGDCDSIAEDVTISIGRNQDRLLVVLEDALRAHGNCVCEIVSAAVRAADGSQPVISQVVELAVTVKPAMAAEISECASAAAPSLVAAVQEGLDRALSDQARGENALPAQVEVEQVEEQREAYEAAQELVSDARAVASRAFGVDLATARTPREGVRTRARGRLASRKKPRLWRKTMPGIGFIGTLTVEIRVPSI